MATTQESIPVEDIKDNILLLKDGGASIVIQTSAVNFGLLSEDEQIAIIDSFAQMLNSLSFAIQINIISRRLDISSYIKLLDKALSLQTNPLLAELMVNYRSFVQSLIKDNEVLDKNFYIGVNVSRLEMGIAYRALDDRLKKAKTILGPRRDQILRQLGRIGLKSNQLSTEQLIKLFYEIYNPKFSEDGKNVTAPAVNLNRPKTSLPITAPLQTQTPVQPAPAPIAQPQTPPESDRTNRNHPFVVEELKG